MSSNKSCIASEDEVIRIPRARYNKHNNIWADLNLRMQITRSSRNNINLMKNRLVLMSVERRFSGSLQGVSEPNLMRAFSIYSVLKVKMIKKCNGGWIKQNDKVPRINMIDSVLDWPMNQWYCRDKLTFKDTSHCLDCFSSFQDVKRSCLGYNERFSTN